MLSYRHAYHAGNHADVLKHWVLQLLLEYLQRKDKGLWYIDSHSGAGRYDLHQGMAAQNAEFASGIARLWQRKDLPEALASYRDAISALNPDGTLKYYPGSPLLAANQLRPQDKAQLFELHPRDVEQLTRLLPQARVTQQDGFAGLKSLLPPPPRRALVLIDPPYEDKRDYQHVRKALSDSLRRFATGTYALWYPLLPREESQALPQQLAKLGADKWLDVQLQISAAPSDGFGMYGSGMFVINPPWTLKEQLESALPWLVKTLGEDPAASYRINAQLD